MNETKAKLGQKEPKVIEEEPSNKNEQTAGSSEKSSPKTNKSSSETNKKSTPKKDKAQKETNNNKEELTMESLRYTPPDRNDDPERQVVLRYVRVDFPPPAFVLQRSDSLKIFWNALKSLELKLYKGMITGAS